MMASFTIEEITTLRDPFINASVGKLNKLNMKQVNDILIEDIGDKIPESEDNIVENHKENYSK